MWLIVRENRQCLKSTACAFDIRLYLTPLGQAKQFIETCGTKNLLCGRKFVYFWASLLYLPRQQKINILTAQYKRISSGQAVVKKISLLPHFLTL
jgi:hypothetical protein